VIHAALEQARGHCNACAHLGLNGVPTPSTPLRRIGRYRLAMPEFGQRSGLSRTRTLAGTRISEAWLQIRRAQRSPAEWPARDTRDSRSAQGTATRMGRDPPPRRGSGAGGGGGAPGPLQARAVGPGRGRKAAVRQNCDRGYPRTLGPGLVSPRDSSVSDFADRQPCANSGSRSGKMDANRSE